MQREGGWNLLCKFFDNMGPIPHHMHQSDEFANRVGHRGQARGVLLSAAVQPAREQFPVHVHGPRARHDHRRCPAVPGKLEPRATTASVPVARVQLQRAAAGRSIRAFCMRPGRLSLRAQVNSDVFAMSSRKSRDGIIDWNLLTKDVPPDHHHDLDYIVGCSTGMRTSTGVREEPSRVPRPVRPFAETEPDGFREQWVCYGTGYYSAKELTVLPKRAITVTACRRLRPDSTQATAASVCTTCRRRR